MGLKFTKEKDILTVLISGDIDHHNAKKIRDLIDQKIVSTEFNTLRIDFKNLSFMDSSGIGLIMGRYKLLESRGANLKVINVPGYFLKVIRLSGLEELGILERSKTR
ncbi:MAG: anti-sigma factor antagonist [Clostridia bacterium]|nr:anti-sigma factor antagonist [Clostridia bacterium]